MNKLLPLLLIGSVSCAPALAQTKYCAGGTLDRLSAADRVTCNAKVQRVHEIAAAMQLSPDWHFVVVCDKDGWSDYVAYAGVEGRSLPQDAAADTDYQRHETFFNGAQMDLAQPAASLQVVTRSLEAIRSHTLEEAVWQDRSKTLPGTHGRLSGF